MRRLIVYFARVGDLVMFTPIIRHLARDTQHGTVDLLVRPWGKTLLGCEPTVERIYTLTNPNRRGVLSVLLDRGERHNLATQLRDRVYDEIITFRGENPSVLHWIESWRGNATVRFISRTIPGAPKHNVDANKNALEFGGYDTTDYDPAPRLTMSSDKLSAAAHRLAPLGKRVVALQAGSSLTHRWWRKQPNLKGLTPQQWSEIICALVAKDHADAFVLHGSAPEKREAQAIIRAAPAHVRPRLHDWTGQVPLSELPAVLAQSYATISVDTGPAHIAAAVGCPLTVIFGPTDPGLFAPRGPGPIAIIEGKAPCQYCHGTKLFKTCRVNTCLTTLAGSRIISGFERVITARDLSPDQSTSDHAQPDVRPTHA
jgi:ADP-heptose:LPS heptosyltransferase